MLPTFFEKTRENSTKNRLNLGTCWVPFETILLGSKSKGFVGLREIRVFTLNSWKIRDCWISTSYSSTVFRGFGPLRGPFGEEIANKGSLHG